MTLMSRVTGLSISDEEHLVQSIQDIITTPYGTRVAVREYGCFLPYIVDKPINRQWVIDAFLYISVALARWEPRYKLYQVMLDASNVSGGQISMDCTGLYKPLGKVMVLDNITLDFEKSHG